MTDEEPKPSKIVRRCKPCDNLSLHVRVVVIDGKPFEVERCAMCDTVPCSQCKGRTLDPTAKECPHCGTDIQIKAKEGEK